MTQPHHPPKAGRRRFLGTSGRWLMTGALLPLAQPALASLPGARSLAFDHTHTSERLALVYALGEQFLPEALTSLNHFLRDHYSGEAGLMDPRLFHLLHQIRQELRVQQPFQVISGYRSPATNHTLRTTRGGGVAKRSLHMDGKAIDVRLPAVLMASSSGRVATTVMGKALMAWASATGSFMPSLPRCSYRMPALMPSRPRRLLRWLDCEREPRGWRSSTSTRSGLWSGNRSRWTVAWPWASISSRSNCDAA